MKTKVEKINIRRATLDDADVLLNLIDTLADYEKLDKPTNDAKERLKIDLLGPMPRAAAYLAEYEGTVVGYAITLFTYSSFLALPTLFIEDIFILEEYRNKGIGTEFYKFCAKLTLEEGCGRMEWVVLDWNKPAIDFYKKLGAEQITMWLPFRMTREQLLKLIN